MTMFAAACRRCLALLLIPLSCVDAEAEETHLPLASVIRGSVVEAGTGLPVPGRACN